MQMIIRFRSDLHFLFSSGISVIIMRNLLIFFFLSLCFYGSSQDSTIYEWYDTEANYPGGESEMMKFLVKNFEYPDSIDNCLSTIYIEFIIEKDGAISNIKAVKKICPQLEKAAIDVIFENA